MEPKEATVTIGTSSLPSSEKLVPPQDIFLGSGGPPGEERCQYETLLPEYHGKKWSINAHRGVRIGWMQSFVGIPPLAKEFTEKLFLAISPLDLTNLLQ